MNDYIKRSDALDQFTYEHGELIPEVLEDGSENTVGVKDVKSALRSIPAADVAPVVRCRECAYATRPGDNIIYCDNFERDMVPDDYCSVGERKEADHADSEIEIIDSIHDGEAYPMTPAEEAALEKETIH